MRKIISYLGCLVDVRLFDFVCAVFDNQHHIF